MTADPEGRQEQRWTRDAAAVASNVSYLRHALVAFAAENGAADGTQSDISIAASEVLTNAVVHAYVGTTPGTMSVRATVADHRLHVTIADDGNGMRPRHDSPGLGLGLPTVIMLAASVSIAPGLDGRGTVVFLQFTLP